jgi:hypothetical protein
MKVNNCTQSEAEAAAQSAALFTGKAHCAVRMPKGEWTWRRLKFVTTMILYWRQRYPVIIYYNGNGKRTARWEGEQKCRE